MDDNTFSEYKQPALPYQRSENSPAPQLREQQAFPQRPVAQPQAYGQQALPQRPVAQPQAYGQQRPAAPARIPKAKAQTIVRRMKRGIVIASFLSFGTFSALVMSHTIGTTASTTVKQASAATPTTHQARESDDNTSEGQTATPTATATTPPS